MKRRWHLTFHGGPDRIHVYSPAGRHIGKVLDRSSLQGIQPDHPLPQHSRPARDLIDKPIQLAVGGTTLSVGSRGSRQILGFRLSNGLPAARPFIDELEDEPEFIELVDQ